MMAYDIFTLMGFTTDSMLKGPSSRETRSPMPSVGRRAKHWLREARTANGLAGNSQRHLDEISSKIARQLHNSNAWVYRGRWKDCPCMIILKLIHHFHRNHIIPSHPLPYISIRSDKREDRRRAARARDSSNMGAAGRQHPAPADSDVRAPNIWPQRPMGRDLGRNQAEHCLVRAEQQRAPRGAYHATERCHRPASQYHTAGTKHSAARASRIHCTDHHTARHGLGQPNNTTQPETYTGHRTAQTSRIKGALPTLQDDKAWRKHKTQISSNQHINISGRQRLPDWQHD